MLQEILLSSKTMESIHKNIIYPSHTGVNSSTFKGESLQV